jgi:hypothetical protein
MNPNPIGKPGGSLIDAGDMRTAALRRISAEQLLHLGARQLGYLQSGCLDGEPVFLLCGADGTPLVVVDAVATAEELAAQHGLALVAVH